MATQPRFASAREIAEFISQHYFPGSERSVRRDWRVRYGLKYVIIAGQSLASVADAEKIAQRLIQTAPPAPASFGGRAA